MLASTRARFWASLTTAFMVYRDPLPMMIAPRRADEALLLVTISDLITLQTQSPEYSIKHHRFGQPRAFVKRRECLARSQGSLRGEAAPLSCSPDRSRASGV